MGAGFVYFVIVENVVRNFRPGWQRGLLTENTAALLTRGGTQLYLDGPYIDSTTGSYTDSGRLVVLSNLHGGLVLGAVVAVVVGLGVLLFVRRDLD